MGTADNESQDPNTQGLVPRFVCDLFDNINQYSQNEKLEASVSYYTTTHHNSYNIYFTFTF